MESTIQSKGVCQVTLDCIQVNVESTIQSKGSLSSHIRLHTGKCGKHYSE